MKLIILVLTITHLTSASCQADPIRLCFYNVENLFDTIDDPSTFDEEFTPSGIKNWNSSKYYQKLKNIGKAILASSNYKEPHLIGLAEVENIKVLEDLLLYSPLQYHSYQIFHEESEDARGIDVAFLIHEDIEVIKFNSYVPTVGFKTRSILNLKFKFYKDTITACLMHLPSRRGGKLQTLKKRLAVVKNYCSNSDSLKIENNIIMGDFNDEFTDSSVQFLKHHFNLENTYYYPSLKYRGKWNAFDLILFDQSFKMKVKVDAIIKAPDFLFMEDVKYGQKKPFRTYLGPNYIGGFSDHLPKYEELYFRNKSL